MNKPEPRKGLLLAIGTAILIFGLLPPVYPNYIILLLTQSLIFCIAAMSLDLLVGYTAMDSIGHGAYFAIGAYMTAILATLFHQGFFVSLLSSIGMAALTASLVGLFVLRAAGIYFLLISLAVAMCIWGVAFQWVAVTKGETGISGIARPDFFVNMSTPVHWYYLVLIAFFISFILMVCLIRSPFGRTMVGIRDSVMRMRVLGYNTWLHRYIAFVIAGAFAGLAGSLHAYYNSYVSPNDADLALCFKLVLMVTIGGPGTLVGAGLGAFIITFLENIVSTWTKRYLLVIAFVYVLSALYAPEGILGWIRKIFGQPQKPSDVVAGTNNKVSFPNT